MPKSYRNSAKWQAERAKARGTARTRRAALAMFAPIEMPGPEPVVPPRPKSLPDDAAGFPQADKDNLMSKGNNLKAPARPQPNVGAKVVKKITCAGLLPKGYEHPRASGDLWLADFFCQVTGCKEETYDGRPYMRWLGDFRRVDCSTGEIVASSTAIFPDIASDRIEAAMLGGENAAGHRQNVQIAFRIGVTGEGRVGMQGYAWTLQTIMQPNYVAPIDRFVAECYQPAAAALTGPEEQAMEEAAAQ